MGSARTKIWLGSLSISCEIACCRGLNCMIFGLLYYLFCSFYQLIILLSLKSLFTNHFLPHYHNSFLLLPFPYPPPQPTQQSPKLSHQTLHTHYTCDFPRTKTSQYSIPSAIQDEICKPCSPL